MSLPTGIRKYSDKIPKPIRLAMKNFTQSDCVLVDRHFATGSRSQQGNCYVNVERQVKKYGGKSIHGWMLNLDERSQSLGIWSWQFHAIWQTPWDTWLDISKYYKYDGVGSKFTTFWVDKTRRSDLNEGTAYNSVVAFERLLPNEMYERYLIPYKVGQLYWTAGHPTYLKKLSQHSGVYRFLTQKYPKNIALLEKKYGVRRESGRLVSTNGSEDVDLDMFFDFTLSVGR
jgi:hypothetical protein